MIKIECIITENKGVRIYYSNIIPRIGETIICDKDETYKVIDVIHYTNENSTVTILMKEI